MLAFPNIDPIAFHLGSWPVHWYGLMYLVGFLGGWGLLRLRIRYSPSDFTPEQLSDIVYYTALGAILRGRFGPTLYHPMAIFAQEASTGCRVGVICPLLCYLSLYRRVLPYARCANRLFSI